MTSMKIRNEIQNPPNVDPKATPSVFISDYSAPIWVADEFCHFWCLVSEIDV